MKKLSKITLKKQGIILNEQEMKNVIGGSTGWCDCTSDGTGTRTGCTDDDYCKRNYGPDCTCRQGG